MNTTDPIDVLRRTDPIDAAATTGFAETARGQEILARIIDDDTATTRPQPRRRLAPLLRVAAIAALGALSIAAAVLISRSPQSPLATGCYQTASQQANTAVIDLDTDGGSAIEACAKIWTQAFSEPVPDSLVACVVTGGGLGVFPADPNLSPDDSCATLGASTPTEGDYAGLTGLDVRRLQAALRQRHDDLVSAHSGCVPLDQATNALGAVAEQHGATAWRTVDLTTSTCTDFVIDAGQGDILIIDHLQPD